jgi:hypothetical protein
MLFTEFLWGPLYTTPQSLPLSLSVGLCDLRPRFLPKGRIGHGYRAIARNGRVLLASDAALAECVDRPARARVQIWHRAILPGGRAEPYGILLCVRTLPHSSPAPTYRTSLVDAPDPAFALAVALGGGIVLEFRRN